MERAKSIDGLRRVGLGLTFLATAACGRAVRAPDPGLYQSIGPLELSAAIDQNSSEILAAVDLMNTSQETIRVVYAGFCEVAVLVYRADARASAPVWDSSRWWSGIDECPVEMLTLEIPPVTLARVVAPLLEVRNISGDSLPLGRYVGAMRFRLVEPRDTTLTLPAGELDLQPGGGIGNIFGQTIRPPNSETVEYRASIADSRSQTATVDPL